MRFIPAAVAVMAVIGGPAAAQPLLQEGERERPVIEKVGGPGGGGDRGRRTEWPEVDRGGGRERELERPRWRERELERPQRAEPRERFRERREAEREELRRDRGPRMEWPEMDRGAGRERKLERPQRAEPRERREAEREELRRDSDRQRAERQQREDAVRERRQQAEQDRERERAANQAEERRAREEERRRVERDRQAEERRQAERDRDRREREDRAGLKQDRERAEREFERERERLRLSDRERTRIRDIIVQREREHTVLRDVDFPVSVGVHVPRHVRLHPIPVDLVEVVPVYRSYQYFTVEDYICIVDPETYAIVQVIDKNRPAAELAVLELTEWERDYVRRHVNWEHARADVRIKLALGVDIPSGVELHGFSDEILSEIPKLRPYRYVVVEDDIVICDPETRDVVLVISS
jgi:hypothetical protein